MALLVLHADNEAQRLDFLVPDIPWYSESERFASIVEAGGGLCRGIHFVFPSYFPNASGMTPSRLIKDD
jgi:hypothetical protein